MGLIKVPDQLIRSLCGNVISQYISYLYSFYDKKIDSENLAIRYNSIIDATFKPINKDINLTTTMLGLPDSVRESWKLEFGYLRLIIDWEQKIWGSRPGVNASYEENDDHGIPGYFTINPRSFMEEVKSEMYNIERVIQIMDKVYYSLWHEASHAVQHNSLKWMDISQVKKSRIVRDDINSSEEDRRIEYLTSLVEFDPQIKTKIYQFRQKYGIDDENTSKNISIFVGSIKNEEETPDDFFRYLKNYSNKKWKKAVKNFYKNYNLDITEIINYIPNMSI